MEHIANSKVFSIGGSLSIIIPAPLCQVMAIEKGTMMAVYREGDRIIYKKGKV